MPGGLVQLVAVGVQDEKLTREPEITFFKSVYRPYVNFAVESIENTFQGVVDFGKRVQVEVQRNGDLVTHMTLEVDIPEICDVSEGESATLAGQYVRSGEQDNCQCVPTDEGIRWAPNLAHTLVRDVSVYVGGSEIDKHYGIWFDAYDDLIQPESVVRGYNDMIGQENAVERAAAQGDVSPYLNNCPAGADPHPTVQNNKVGQRSIELLKQGLQTTRTATDQNGNAPDPDNPDTLDCSANFNCHPARRLYLPLRFWFNVNPGLALPLIALQFHQVKIQVLFRERFECITLRSSPDGTRVPVLSPALPNLQGASLWVDYVFLDNDARQHFAQNPHEYLIKQLQFNQAEPVTNSTAKVRLNFNHPTSELVWWVQEDGAVTENENLWNNYDIFDPAGPAFTLGLHPGDNQLLTCKLRMNGQDRFQARTGDYFTRVQPYYHHTRVPTRSRSLASYAFGLDSEEHQPQGTANFSRIDTSTVDMTLANIDSGNPGKAYVFAVNYNFFRVAGGMGGLAFAA